MMKIQKKNWIEIKCPPEQKIYFASDFHLGSPNKEKSLEREKKVVDWLSGAAKDAAHIFLLGDVFDFWFEYKVLIPKGFTRLLGKLAELSDQGIGISIFTGNHDMWMGHYFTEEFNATIYRNTQYFLINEKKFLLAHGDGLGPGDKGYKRLKRFLNSRFTHAAFALLPSRWSFGLADKFSKTSRGITQEEDFLGEEKEWLLQFAREELKTELIHYFIFGHRHLPLDIELTPDSRMINLGDWVSPKHYTYAVFDGKSLVLKRYGA